MKYTFTLRGLTPSLNAASRASGHWAAKHKAKKALQSTWAWEIATSLMPDKPAMLRRARVTVYRHSVGTLDADNAYGGCKALIDVLKPASKRNPHGLGLIEDDSPEHLLLDVRQVRAAKRADQKTVVVIEPLHVVEPV